MGDVVQFPYHPSMLPPLPEPPKRCDDCDQAAFSHYGIYCRLFREDISNASVAEDCAEFAPIPTSPRTVIR